MNKPKFINRCLLQGYIANDPVIKAISPTTDVTTFQLVMVESWVNNHGERRDRKNRVTVEVVGRDAKRIHDTATRGMWASVEGYYRSEIFKGREVLKVRTLDVDVWRVD